MNDEVVQCAEVPPASSGGGEAAGAHKPSAYGGFRSFFGLSLLANHFPELHGVRVLAIVCVLQWHVTSIMLINGLIRTPGGAHFALRSLTCFFGMDLFFVLSGYLIGSMLLHATKSGEASGIRGVARFYARRAFRTFPLYYVVLLVLASLLPFTPIKRENLPYELVYLTNYRPLVTEDTVTMLWGWSLCVEEHFYLAVPLLVGALRLLKGHRARLLFLALLWVSGIFVRIALFRASGNWTEADHFQAFYIKTHSRYDTLIAGILLAYVQFHLREPLRAWLARPVPKALMTGVALACLFLLLFPHEIAGPKHYNFYRLFCWGTFTSLLYLTSLPLLLHSDGPLKRALSHRWFLKLATLGYGTYLVHIPVFEYAVMPFLRLFTAMRWPFALVWTTGLVSMWAISLLLSYVLHVVVEKPALALRDRLVP
jgi:peptidoglycan/LPS O-acetylase OafA/YrhL